MTPGRVSARVRERLFAALCVICVSAVGTYGCHGGGGSAQPPSNDSNLAALALDPGELDQFFQPGQHAYTATVSYLAPTARIGVLPADSAATVTVNGAPSAPGSRAVVSLVEGLNPPIAVVVTSADGSTQTTYTLTVTRRLAAAFAQRAYVKASNTDAQDQFGWAIAASGDVLAVGAPLEKSSATGINGNQSDNSLTSGAVYVLSRDAAGTWSQEAYVKPSSISFGDGFGAAVALSGNTLAVGAPNEDSAATGINGNQPDETADASGAVYVFVRDGTGAWRQQAYIKASNTGAGDDFGRHLAIAGDTLVVGASGEDSGARGPNGDQADNSATDAGAAYVFGRDAGGNWTQQAYLKGSNTQSNARFGDAVAVDGDAIAVGAEFEDNTGGAAYLFRRGSSGAWTQEARLKGSNTEFGDFFGQPLALYGDTLAVAAGGESSAATGVNGNQSDNSATSSGAVYVFSRLANGTWAQQAYLKASNTEKDDSFGIDLALHGDTLAVGAPGEDSAASNVGGNQSDNSLFASGAVYAFGRDASRTWRQLAYVKASNPGGSNAAGGDVFGLALAFQGDALVVAAIGEDSSAVGLNGDQADDSATNSGAAYVFE
jgi:hypothetical protein